MTRQSRRRENVAFQARIKALTQNPSLDGGIAAPRAISERNRPLRTGVRKRKSGRKRVPARKRAFARLKELRDTFVKLRAKYRTGGHCEVGMVCKGRGAIEVVYHVFPAAMGNAIKHDARNLLGSCNSCNGGEYFARKRGD